MTILSVSFYAAVLYATFISSMSQPFEYTTYTTIILLWSIESTVYIMRVLIIFIIVINNNNIIIFFNYSW